MSEKKTVFYSEYGAIGDGVTDDHAAILAAHVDANEKGYEVKADEGKTYYIPPHTETIPIMTNVDWTGASFIIDDRDIFPKTRDLTLISRSFILATIA